VAQILNRQHQILVAAIQAGKSGRLAELSRQQGDRKSTAPSAPFKGAIPPSPPKSMVPAGREVPAPAPAVNRQALGPRNTVEVVSPPGPSLPEYRMVEALTFDQIIAGYLQHIPLAEQLRVEVLYPSKFRAGDEVTVRAAVLHGGANPTSGAQVKLQILGTKIEAQTWTGKTDLQGLVSFQVKIPLFTAGAAALILKAQAPDGQEAETKFMIASR
jgi:hypothetical protein